MRASLALVAGVFFAAVALGIVYWFHDHGRKNFAGLSAEHARTQAVRFLHQADPLSSLLVINAGRSVDPRTGEDAWEVEFRATRGFGSGFSGCVIYVRSDVSHFGADRCTGWRN